MELLTESEALETLLLRLVEMHPQRSFLDRQLYRIDGGARGEQRLMARFKEFWVDGEFSVLWNVNLAPGNWPVQMDGLLLHGRSASPARQTHPLSYPLVSAAGNQLACRRPGRLHGKTM